MEGATPPPLPTPSSSYHPPPPHLLLLFLLMILVLLLLHLFQPLVTKCAPDPPPSGIPKWSASPSPLPRPSVSSTDGTDAMTRSTLARQRLLYPPFIPYTNNNQTTAK